MSAHAVVADAGLLREIARAARVMVDHWDLTEDELDGPGESGRALASARALMGLADLVGDPFDRVTVELPLDVDPDQAGALACIEATRRTLAGILDRLGMRIDPRFPVPVKLVQVAPDRWCPVEPRAVPGTLGDDLQALTRQADRLEKIAGRLEVGRERTLPLESVPAPQPPTESKEDRERRRLAFALGLWNEGKSWAEVQAATNARAKSPGNPDGWRRVGGKSHAFMMQVRRYVEKNEGLRMRVGDPGAKPKPDRECSQS